ncbi:MAG: EAL domain-containing protein [Roseivivax sp.]|nr:EAL domain-containing protein [Roseivivax sp.]
MAFVPALALAGYWFGGEATLWPIALGVPMLVFLAGAEAKRNGPATTRQAAVINPGLLKRVAQVAMGTARSNGSSAVCILFGPSGALPDGPAGKAMRAALLLRLRDGLRDNDTAGWTEDGTLAVVLQPGQMLDLDAAQQAARRLQARLEDPVPAQSRLWHVSIAVGIATSTRLRPGASGADLVAAAVTALQDARSAGASAVRIFAPTRRAATRPAHVGAVTAKQALAALEAGQIVPWFQPQLCTETGRISGVEALARWQNQTRGLIAPDQFLPALERANALPKLCDAMLVQSCQALRAWDAEGADIPAIAVNFSEQDLTDPLLVDRVRHTLETYGIAPQRLRVEVTESVALGPSNTEAANAVSQLADLGCRIDLDDFGTGATTLTALQRVPVHRLKIDRSFVTRVDRDNHQHQLLAAIVGLAERLGVETLAEGVESHGEHALVAQMGCTHVQGFGIARPMPADLIPNWVEDHKTRLARLPRLSLVRGTGTALGGG